MRSLYNNKPLNNDSKNVIHNESSVDSDIAEIRIINNSSPSKESHSNIKDNSLLGNGKSSKNETTPRLNFSKGKKRKNEIENDIENSLLKKANTNGMDNNGTFMIIEPTTSFDDMGGVDQQKYVRKFIIIIFFFKLIIFIGSIRNVFIFKTRTYF